MWWWAGEGLGRWWWMREGEREFVVSQREGGGGVKDGRG